MSYCPNKLEIPCKPCGKNADWDNETEKTGWNWEIGFMPCYVCANCYEPLYKSLDNPFSDKHE